MDKALALALPATFATLGVVVGQSLGVKSVWVQLGTCIVLAGAGIAAAGAIGAK